MQVSISPLIPYAFALIHKERVSLMLNRHKAMASCWFALIHKAMTSFIACFYSQGSVFSHASMYKELSPSCHLRIHLHAGFESIFRLVSNPFSCNLRILLQACMHKAGVSLTLAPTKQWFPLSLIQIHLHAGFESTFRFSSNHLHITFKSICKPFNTHSFCTMTHNLVAHSKDLPWLNI